MLLIQYKQFRAFVHHVDFVNCSDGRPVQRFSSHVAIQAKVHRMNIMDKERNGRSHKDETARHAQQIKGQRRP
jgi:hypothetical protein